MRIKSKQNTGIVEGDPDADDRHDVSVDCLFYVGDQFFGCRTRSAHTAPSKRAGQAAVGTLRTAADNSLKQQTTNTFLVAKK